MQGDYFFEVGNIIQLSVPYIMLSDISAMHEGREEQCLVLVSLLT